VAKDILKRNVNVQIFKSNIFSRILYKTNFSNKNSNRLLLGIDILKEDKKKDLVLIASQKVEQMYTDLLTQQNLSPVLAKKGKILFFKCIKSTCEDFLTKQYGYKVKINLSKLKNTLYTKHLLRDTTILFKVPLYSILDPQSPEFRLIYFPVYNYASENFIETLIDHLIIEISNCVIYFILINFSTVYLFRQTLYRSKFLSLRNFERFKNNLGWQLHIKTYIQRPVDLYNNRYNLYVWRTSGIYFQTIYANRSKEIASLTKLPLLTLIFIEGRDFLISRLDEALFIISKGVRFTLTSVIGQFIGLIWRGVIEGLKK
jgi:hypothetical protein